MTQTPSFDILTMGRSSIDLYANDIGAPFAEIQSFAAYVGGSPTNIAVGCRRLGLEAALLTAVGTDKVGDFIVHFLEQEGVATEYIPTKAGARSSAVLLGIEENAFPLIFYRDNAADIQLTIDDVLASPIDRCRSFEFSGTGLSKEPSRSATLFAAERASQRGATVFLDLDFRADQRHDPRAFGVTVRAALKHVTVDTTTGTETVIAPFIPEAGHTISGLSWDPTTDTLFASSTDSTESALYTIDPSDGSQALIGTTNVATTLIDIAVDPVSGVLYGHDIITDSIYTIDKTDGSATLVGPTGFDATFAQGMDFNDATGLLYLALYEGGGVGSLLVADTSDGSTFSIGTLTRETDAFAIAASTGDSVAPSIVVHQTVGTDAGSCATTDQIMVLEGTTVYFCYSVINVGQSTFTSHDLDDAVTGTILSGLALNLAPGESTDTFNEGVTIPAIIDDTVLNIGTWSALNGTTASAQAGATVIAIDEASFPSDPEPDTAIPDSDPVGITDTLTITENGTIDDLDVALDISHTFVGDLIVTLEHVDTGTTVTILDRPGVPATGFGCAGDNILAVLDDEAAITAEDNCGATADPSPGLNDGPYIPNSPLSAFDGEDILGDWALTISDNAGIDTGTLNSWSLDAELLVPEIALAVTVGTDPLSCGTDTSLVVPAGTTVFYCYTVSNLGDLTLSLHDLSDDQLGTLLSTSHGYL